MRKKRSMNSKISKLKGFYQFPPAQLKLAAIKKRETRCDDLLKRFDALTSRKQIFPKIFNIERQLEIYATASTQDLKVSLKDWLYHQMGERMDSGPFRILYNYDEGLALVLSKKRSAFNAKFLCKIHGVMKRECSLESSEIGNFRKKQNWIGPSGCSFQEAYFFPLPPDEVEGAMLELEKFIRAKGDPLIQLAIYFAQLLIIHPFMDGNGRVARALIPQVLCQKKLIKTPLFFMSRYFARHRLEYFQRLYAITSEGDWRGWVQFFLKGILEEGRMQIKRREALVKLYHRALVLFGADPKTVLILQCLFEYPIFCLEDLKKKQGGKEVYMKLKGAKWLAPYPKDRRFVYLKTLFKLL